MPKELLQNSKGFSIIEIVVAAAIFVLLATGLTSAWVYGLRSNISGGNRTRALFLAEEGMEAARSIKDGSFANLVDGTHGLSLSGGKWIFNGVSDVTENVTRTVFISTIDAQTKFVSTTVTWQERKEPSKVFSLAEYITDWSKRTVGNWANPILYGEYNASRNTDGSHIVYKGDYAYLVRNGATPNFLVYNLTAPSAPTAVTNLTLVGNINGMVVDGNYLYLTSSDNNAELIILDISNPATPILLTTYDMSGNLDAYGVYISSGNAFVSRAVGVDKEFIVLDISNPAAPTVIGSVDTVSLARDIVVIGNYAYLSTTNVNLEVNVINLTNITAPVLLSGFNISGNNVGNTIVGFDTTIFVGLSTGKISIINISNPNILLELSSYTVGAGRSAVNDLQLGIDNTHLFTGTSNSSMEFHVIDVINLNSPAALGLLNLTGNLFGISYDPDKDLIYAASSDNSRELVVIAPQ